MTPKDIDYRISIMRKISPSAARVYDTLPNKSDWNFFMTGESLYRDLPTALHESVHAITKDYYPLIDGDSLPVVPLAEEMPFYPPKLIAHKFDGELTEVQIYLSAEKEAASSGVEFQYLLNELNAYSHDLNFAVAMYKSGIPRTEIQMHRDGLSSLIAFVSAYVEHAITHEKDTYSLLTSPGVKHIVCTLWWQALTVLTESLDIPDFGENDVVYLKTVNTSKIKGYFGKDSFGFENWLKTPRIHSLVGRVKIPNKVCSCK